MIGAVAALLLSANPAVTHDETTGTTQGTATAISSQATAVPAGGIQLVGCIVGLKPC